MGTKTVSAGYKALVDGLIYAFKDKESKELKKASWTPHNIKTLLITRTGIFVEGYCSDIPVTEGKSSLIKFEGTSADDYTDMLCALYDLPGGMSAVVPNVREILILVGNGKYAIPFFKDEVAAKALLGYSDNPEHSSGRKYPSVESYAHAKSSFTLPTISFVSAPDFVNSFWLNAAVKKDAAASVVKSALSRAVSLPPCIYLQREDDIRWKVISEGKFVARDETQSQFMLSDAKTAYVKLSHLVRVTDIISLFGGKLGVTLVYASTKPEPDTLSEFLVDSNESLLNYDLNSGNYAADKNLRRYLGDNYYKPFAVYEYLFSTMATPVGAELKKYQPVFSKSNAVYNALTTAANTNTTAVWAMPDYDALVKRLFVAKLGKKAANIDIDALFSLYRSIDATTKVSSIENTNISAAVICETRSAYVDSIYCLVQSIVVISLFSHGLMPDTRPSDTFGVTIDSLYKTFGVSKLILKSDDFFNWGLNLILSDFSLPAAGPNFLSNLISRVSCMVAFGAFTHSLEDEGKTHKHALKIATLRALEYYMPVIENVLKYNL